MSLCPPKHVVSFSEPLDFLVCLCPELCPYVQIFMRTASSRGAEPNLAQLDGWSHLALAHVSRLHSSVSQVVSAMVLKKPSAFLLKTSIILLFRRKCFFITRYTKTIITLNNENFFAFTCRVILQYEGCDTCPSPSCFTHGFYVSVSSWSFTLSACFSSCLWLVYPFVLFPLIFSPFSVKALRSLKIFSFTFPSCSHSSSLTYMHIIYANQESLVFCAPRPSFCCPS